MTIVPPLMSMLPSAEMPFDVLPVWVNVDGATSDVNCTVTLDALAVQGRGGDGDVGSVTDGDIDVSRDAIGVVAADVQRVGAAADGDASVSADSLTTLVGGRHCDGDVATADVNIGITLNGSAI